MDTIDSTRCPICHEPSKGLHNVAKPLVGKTVLTEQGLEDIVAYLLDATKGP